MKIEVILTGAQGTGKTTVLNHYKGSYLNVITEMARGLAKKGVKINENGDGESQQIIFNECVRLLNQDFEYIADRGLTDVIAYTTYLVDHGRADESVLMQQLNILGTFVENHQNAIICYFPIEFDVVDDGLRSTDEKFRHEIDENIKSLLDVYFPNHYITVHGTVEERIKQIDKEINKASII